MAKAEGINLRVTPEVKAQLAQIQVDGGYRSMTAAATAMLLKGMESGPSPPSSPPVPDAPVDPLEVVKGILPAGSDIKRMVGLWEWANSNYWNRRLRPCWLTCNISKYGKAVASWSSADRTINIVPRAFQEGVWASVLVHEMCHQAQTELYRHLDQRRLVGGTGDDSHRCPSWSRACWDVIYRELNLTTGGFVPCWRRSTGNRWFPWVPEADPETWEIAWEDPWIRVEPDSTFLGKPLLDLGSASNFGPEISAN